MALAAYATENDIPQLSVNQLDLVSKVTAALLPIEEVTKCISADVATRDHSVPSNAICDSRKARQRQRRTDDER